jgi:hypothetical protein
MTRTWLVLIAALAAAGLAALLLFGGERRKPSAEEALREAADRERLESAQPPPLPGTSLAPGVKVPGSDAPKPAAGPHGSVDVRLLPKGTLVVVVVGADDQPLPVETLHVQVGPARGAREWVRAPVVTADPETKTWRADEVPAGSVEVRVSGDHVLEKAVTVQQTSEGGEPVKVQVERAGAIQYSVTLADGTVPAEITLSLLDEKERPVQARFQSRSATVLSTPRTATTVKVGPEGVVMGVRPGRYVLRATSPTENTADTKVDVVAGETTLQAVIIRA